MFIFNSVPGSGAFLTPWIRDPEKTYSHIFESLVTIKLYNSLKIGPFFFLKFLKIKYFYFVKFVATKKVMKNLFSPLSFAVVLYLGWVKIRIRVKHPGSATLKFKDFFPLSVSN